MAEYVIRNDNGYLVNMVDLGDGIIRVSEHRSTFDVREFHVINNEVWTVKDGLEHKLADMATAKAVKSWINPVD